MKSKCEFCGTECHPQEADIIEQGMRGLAKAVDESPLTKIGGAIGQRIMGKNGESIGKFCGAFLEHGALAGLHSKIISKIQLIENKEVTLSV